MDCPLLEKVNIKGQGLGNDRGDLPLEFILHFLPSIRLSPGIGLFVFSRLFCSAFRFCVRHCTHCVGALDLRLGRKNRALLRVFTGISNRTASMPRFIGETSARTAIRCQDFLDPLPSLLIGSRGCSSSGVVFQKDWTAIHRAQILRPLLRLIHLQKRGQVFRLF